MDKSKLKKMALMGMTGGLLVASQTSVQAVDNVGTVLAHSCGNGTCGAARPQNHGNRLTADATLDQKNRSTYTEADLLNDPELSEQNKALYRSLNPEGKRRVLEQASQACSGKSTCAGGKQDKNQIVRSVSDEMAAKRGNLAQ